MKAGIAVIDRWAQTGREVGNQWLFRVWDRRTRRWNSKSFAAGDKAKGWAWAENERSLLELELTTTGSLPFAVVAKAYHDAQVDRDLNEKYTDEVKRLADAVVEAGIVDLKDKDFQDKVRKWLTNAPSFVEGREQPGPVTRNRWLVILKSIAKLGVTKFGLRTNPLTGIKPFKFDKKVKSALRVDELRAMVADAMQADPYYRQACLLVYAGMRADEAAHTRREWIDREAKTITLRVIRDAKGKVVWAPKGNKERIIKLLDELDDLLGSWGTAGTGYVVEEVSLRALEDKGHWKSFREYLGRCRIGDQPIDAAARDLSPHSTRHSWASVMLATGASPNRVKRWLGHEKLQTTDIYADAEAMYEVAVADWPRAQMRLRPKAAEPAATFVLDCTRDPMAFLREFVHAGGSIGELAAASGVAAATLKGWFFDGAPEAVRDYMAALAAHAALAAAGAPARLPVTPRLTAVAG